jgi:ABC-2 type transport system ATP-binding protein
MDTAEELVIEAHALMKSYGETKALAGVTLSVQRGRTVALIGPNGAGKSTLVEIFMGLRRPDSGTVRVLGIDIVRHPRAHVAQLGVQLQESRLFAKLRVREYLEFFADLYGRPLAIGAVAESLGLQTFLEKRIIDISGGQRQRVALALAIINDPTILILDEPTVGLDPITRREFWKLIRQLQGAGKTVLFTTHYMEEAQALATEILMISHGRIVAHGTSQEIVDAARCHGEAASLDDAYALFSNERYQESA